MLDPNTISTGRDLYPGDNRVALDIAKSDRSTYAQRHNDL